MAVGLVDYFLYEDAINSNFAKIEETERLKGCLRKETILFIILEKIFHFLLIQQNLLKTQRVIIVYYWLPLNYERYFIWRVILEPSDLDEKKETFIFEKATEYKDFDEEINGEYLSWYKFVERLRFNISTVGSAIKLLEKKKGL